MIPPLAVRTAEGAPAVGLPVGVARAIIGVPWYVSRPRRSASRPPAARVEESAAPAGHPVGEVISLMLTEVPRFAGRPRSVKPPVSVRTAEGAAAVGLPVDVITALLGVPWLARRPWWRIV